MTPYQIALIILGSVYTVIMAVFLILAWRNNW